MSSVTCGRGVEGWLAGQARCERADLLEAFEKQVEPIPSSREKGLACGGGKGERGLERSRRDASRFEVHLELRSRLALGDLLEGGGVARARR